MQVSIISIAVNAVLTLFKLFVGIAAQSGAMVSDAVHSASDVFSTLIVIAGVTVAEKRPDSGHPYGHERMECVASLLLAVILAATGIGIGAAGMKRIAEGGLLAVPGMAALLAAVISIAVKEWMFRFTKRAAGRIKSGALMADAWHHRSDARVYVDVEISMDGSKSLADSHRTAEAVHLAVENAIPEVKHCMVHVNPLGKEKESMIPSD